MSEPPPPPDRRPSRTPQQEIGTRAELLVVRHLTELGLQILGVNVRVGRFEIDILARDGEVIVVVEVRTRGAGSYVRALDSVTPQKRMRVRRAGTCLWRQRFSRMPGVERMRFDVAAVNFGPEGRVEIEYIRAAF